VLNMLHQSAAAEQMMFSWPWAWAKAELAASTREAARRVFFTLSPDESPDGLMAGGKAGSVPGILRG